MYESNWARFGLLPHTKDSLVRNLTGWRRLLARPLVTVLIPVEDATVRAQLIAWQDALRDWLPYAPMPPDQLHITLHSAGVLSERWSWLLPHAWKRSDLALLADRLRPAIAACAPFEVRLGPLNAFSTVLLAEVQDESECLRALRIQVRRALPRHARAVTQRRFLPHVTLGYWGCQPVQPLVAALAPFRQVEPLPLLISRVRLTTYTRNAAPFGPDVLHTAIEEICAEFELTG